MRDDAPDADWGKEPLRVTKRTKPTLLDRVPSEIDHVTEQFDTLKIKKPEDIVAAENALAEKFELAYNAIIAGNLTDLAKALEGIAPERIRAIRICDIDPTRKASRCWMTLCCVSELFSGCLVHKMNRALEGSLLELALRMRAVSKTAECLNIINYLLHLNFDLNKTNFFVCGNDIFHGSSLHMAVIDRDLELLMLLLTYRDHIDVDIRNIDGMTALMVAAKGGKKPAVTMLLAAGADASITKRLCCCLDIPAEFMPKSAELRTLLRAKRLAKEKRD